MRPSLQCGRFEVRPSILSNAFPASEGSYEVPYLSITFVAATAVGFVCLLALQKIVG
jgi:hypothetical protein